jgi:hypothetical protein
MLTITQTNSPRIPPSQRARRSSAPALPPLTILRLLFEAVRESLSAHRHYEELRSKGVAHDSALRQALALAPAPVPSRSGCEELTPLWFAGRA